MIVVFKVCVVRLSLVMCVRVSVLPVVLSGGVALCGLGAVRCCAVRCGAVWSVGGGGVIVS